MSGAKEALQKHIQEAKQYLKQTSLNINLLIEITDLVASRDH
jgi:geranylgeranyl diphosphate synthase type II